MMGVGVGFDTKGSRQHIKLYRPDELRSKTFIIEDTREAWVESLKLLLETYVKPDQQHVDFDYTRIRPPGIPLRTFGGTSSGYGPLKTMHDLIRKQLDKRVGDHINSRDVVDIMNIIGKCVVAGNIRRVAEIALGEAND